MFIFVNAASVSTRSNRLLQTFSQIAFFTFSLLDLLLRLSQQDQTFWLRKRFLGELQSFFLMKESERKNKRKIIKCPSMAGLEPESLVIWCGDFPANSLSNQPLGLVESFLNLRPNT